MKYSIFYYSIFYYSIFFLFWYFLKLFENSKYMIIHKIVNLWNVDSFPNCSIVKICFFISKCNNSKNLMFFEIGIFGTCLEFSSHNFSNFSNWKFFNFYNWTFFELFKSAIFKIFQIGIFLNLQIVIFWNSPNWKFMEC